jgi:hypothetical protein
VNRFGSFFVSSLRYDHRGCINVSSFGTQGTFSTASIKKGSPAWSSVLLQIDMRGQKSLRIMSKRCSVISLMKKSPVQRTRYGRSSAARPGQEKCRQERPIPPSFTSNSQSEKRQLQKVGGAGGRPSTVSHCPGLSVDVSKTLINSVTYGTFRLAMSVHVQHNPSRCEPAPNMDPSPINGINGIKRRSAPKLGAE